MEEKRSHYQALGVRRKATADEIKAAYRSQVRSLHPDAQGAESASPEFHALQEAYAVLSDPDKRKHYDAMLALEERAAAQKAELEASRARAEMAKSGGAIWDAPTESRQQQSGETLDQQLRRLSELVRNKQWAEAEKLASAIVQISHSAVEAHEVLGDTARRREDYKTAAKHYGYAAQYSPHNDKYIELYEEMSTAAETPRAAVQGPVGGDTGVPASQGNEMAPFMLVLFVWLICLSYVAFAPEPGLGEAFDALSEISFGRILVALLAGITMGLWFNVGGAGGAFRASARDGVGGPNGLLIGSVIGLFLFWPVMLIWLGFSAVKRIWDKGQIKFGVGVIILTALFAVAGLMRSPVLGLQMALYAGGPILFGGIITWATTEPLRSRSGRRPAR